MFYGTNYLNKNIDRDAAHTIVSCYSMFVATLPCYNQYQVPYGTWYSNPALERLP